MQYVLPITIATRGTFSDAHPSPTTTTHQRGATPHHDRNPVAAGEHHAPSVTREQSRGHKTSGL